VLPLDRAVVTGNRPFKHRITSNYHALFVARNHQPRVTRSERLLFNIALCDC